MAIGRISGQMLKANLQRSGVDLAFETNLLVLDVTNSYVGIGTATPSRQLHISGTGAIRLPSGTDGERGSAANGDIRYNTTQGYIEGYSNGTWKNLTDQGIDSVAQDTAPQLGGNLDINGFNITSARSNEDINIIPSGTGSVAITKVDINGGAIDGTVIGASSAAAGTFTTLTASTSLTANTIVTNDISSTDSTAIQINDGANISGTLTANTFSSSSATITGGTINNSAIGGTTAAAGAFTTLTASTSATLSPSGAVTINPTTAGTINNMSIGATTAAAGTFTNLTASTSATLSPSGAVTINPTTAGTINNMSIGATTAAAGTFTNLTGNGTITITGTTTGSMNNVAIGASTAASGKFTTIESSGNVTVGGNLTVNGSTTTIESTTLSIEDPLLILAKNNSGGAGNTYDQGLLFNRGSLSNVSFFWDESADEFVFATTAAETGSTAGNITIDSYQQLKAGIIKANTSLDTGAIKAADGTASITIANSTGAVTANNFSSSSATITGGTINGSAIGGTTAAAGAFTTLTASTSATLSPSGAVTINPTTAGTINNMSIGATTAAAGAFTTLTASTSATLSPSGAVTINPTTVGTINNMSIGATTAAAGTFTNLTGNGTITITGTTTGSMNNVAIGGTTAAAGAFTTLTASTSATLSPSGAVTINPTTAGTINNMSIGATTRAAASFTTVDANDTITISADNKALRIGAGNDLQLSHDGTDTTIANSTGILKIDGAASSSIKINAAAANVDTQISGDTVVSLFYVDASADKIGIGTSTPTYILDAGSNTGAIRVPNGNTAQRPTANTGVIRFNTTTGFYEGSQDGSTWVQFTMGTGGTIAINKVTTTGDGSTSTFNGFFSTAPATANNVMVYIDNVYQEPTENYTVSSNNITFTSAPHSGARIFAIEGFDNTAVQTGGVARTLTEATTFESSATTIMSFNASNYRSAELYVQVTDAANTEYSCMKAHVIHNGTTAYINTYGVVNTGGSDTATLTATYTSGTVNVQAISTGGTSSAIVQYSLAAV
jgi:hypothetical protein